MGAFVGRRADTFERKHYEWLWRPFIPRHEITLLTAEPGTGKSTIACDIAASLSRGDTLWGETKEVSEKRGILRTWFLNAEDDPERTIVWRLDNQGADRTQIWINEHVEPVTPDNVAEIIREVKANGISLLVVDPIQAWIAGDTDMYRPNSMRAWGNLYRQIIQQTGTTVLWVRHRRKGNADDHSTLNSGLGSIDLSGIVRSEIGVSVTAKGSKITRIKGSVGRTQDSLYYSIKETDNEHGQLFWSGEIAQEKATKPKRKHDPIQTWVVQQLEGGPKHAIDLLESGKTIFGKSRSTIYNHVADMVVKEDVDGRSMWRLKTPHDANDPAGRHEEEARDAA